jgi:hypothetical protein
MLVGVEQGEQPKPAKKTVVRFDSTPTSMHVLEKCLSFVSSDDVVRLRRIHLERGFVYDRFVSFLTVRQIEPTDLEPVP